MNDEIALNSTIMVIDDSFFILKAIQAILSDIYNVIIAQSAKTALQMLENNIPDLILLDLEMPETDGFEFLEMLKGNSERNDIPVIFLTGADDRKKEEQALNLGAVDYILKPISEGVLKKRIYMHLALHTYQRDLERLIYKKTSQLREAVKSANEASRLKSVFLANMSHEIRTPMNSIIGFSELALDDNISLRTRDYLGKIKSSSEDLLQIINDILDISKIEAGRTTLEHIPFSIGEIFRACQIAVTPKALEKGITLFCYAEPSIGKKLIGDPTRLRQVLLNLLSNAIKFTNIGIVKLLSCVEESPGNSVKLHFEIKDSGIGMSPEQVERVFEPFIQADDTTTRKYGGTGLGLSITKSIIELMGGELKAESTPGVGSRFYFDLTFETIDDCDITPQEAEIFTLEKPLFKGEVLVCEDNAMNQQVALEHLSRVGLGVVIAQNGKEGVEFVKMRMAENKPPFDLIFMDIHMPVMDGLDATRELITIGNVSPVVALTANIMPDNKEMYDRLKMSDCLAKPFSAQELWRCLLKYIAPVDVETIDKSEQDEADSRLSRRLLINFCEDNKTSYREIADAIEAGDFKQAHMRTHTLKGVAGLIGKNALRKAANAVELSLSSGKTKVSAEYMDALEFELNAVINELSQMFGANAANCDNPRNTAEALLDATDAIKLLNKLELMLIHGDTDCLDLKDELRGISGTETLIAKIERFDFASARGILAGIRQELEECIYE